MNLNVKHIQQSASTSCGAAVLSMIYNHNKIIQTENMIWSRLKKKRENVGGEYIKTLDMAQDALKFDLTYFYGQVPLDNKNPVVKTIKEFLNLNIPIAVCQKISEKNQLGHFRLVVGIGNKYVYLNDPQEEKGNTKISIQRFINLWKPAKNGEVIGGEFFTIFNKKIIEASSEFFMTSFQTPTKSFSVRNLKFN